MCTKDFRQYIAYGLHNRGELIPTDVGETVFYVVKEKKRFQLKICRNFRKINSK